MIFRSVPATLAVMTVLACAPAFAAGDEASTRLGRYGAWEAFSYGEGGGKTCYIATAAEKVSGGAASGKVVTYLIVTHRSGGKGQDEISLNAGYDLKKGSEVALEIGPTKHVLFTRGNRAWAHDATADKAIVADLRKGRSASFHAVPAKGAEARGTIPLNGFALTLQAADKACGIKR